MENLKTLEDLLGYEGTDDKFHITKKEDLKIYVRAKDLKQWAIELIKNLDKIKDCDCEICIVCGASISGPEIYEKVLKHKKFCKNPIILENSNGCGSCANNCVLNFYNAIKYLFNITEVDLK